MGRDKHRATETERQRERDRQTERERQTDRKKEREEERHVVNTNKESINLGEGAREYTNTPPIIVICFIKKYSNTGHFLSRDGAGSKWLPVHKV